MARWGEGDARWLVQDMAVSGTNVGDWHWVEKDRLRWSRERCAELFEGLTVDCSPGITVKKVLKVEGEAAVSQRKGTKKLAVFDLTLELEWRARASADAAEVVGKLKVTEFASHSDEDDILFECTKTLAPSDAEWAAMQVLAKSKLQPAVIAALHTFAADLLATFDAA